MSKKKKKFSLKKLIYNDKYLIILSIIAAVVIWIASSMNLSPETTKKVSVPLAIDFTNSAVEQLGLKCYGEEKLDIEVTISVKKYLAKDVTADDITASLMTNYITSTGNHDVPIVVSASSENASFNITSYYPTAYSAYFDVEDEKTMEIDLNFIDDDFIADGYVMGDPLLSESSVTVSGPKTYLSQVDRVVSNVNIDDKLSESVTVDLTLEAVNAYDTDVEYVSVNSASENVSLTIPILKKEKVKLTAKLTDAPENADKSAVSVSYSNASVNAGVLESANITSVKLGNISYSQLGVGENTFTFALDQIDGVKVLDSISEVTVTVQVSSDYAQQDITISQSDIRLTNVPEGYQATLSKINTSVASVIGPSESVADFTANDLTIRCDLNAIGEDDLAAGTIQVPLTFVVSDGVSWVYGNYTADVVLVKEE